MADLLLATVAKTIQTFVRNNWKGRQAGFLSVLHTWGSALNWHPHVHVLLSAGTASRQTGRWKEVSPNYAFPVQGAMRKVFAAIFVRRLEGLEEKGSIQWPAELQSVEQRRRWRIRLVQAPWNIHVQPTLKNTRAVVRYLARYTSRIAISNARILKIDREAGTVDFRWKDYRNGGRKKVMRLSIGEFLHRFARHLVPRGFHRIRQYGFLNGRKGRFREIAGAPQRSISEARAEPGTPKCTRCSGQEWTYHRIHGRGANLEIKGPPSFSLVGMRAGP